MLVFDILSAGLDIGDAGGYNKMGSKSMYYARVAGGGSVLSFVLRRTLFLTMDLPAPNGTSCR